MPTTRIAFLGDVFGAPGRRVVEQQLPRLRSEHAPDLVIANAENAARGLGCTPDLYRRLRGYGIDAITLGDHCFREMKIVEVLRRPEEPISRPANMPKTAAGREYIRLARPGRPDVIVITVLGRVFLTAPADDPFAAVDRILDSLGSPRPIVIVEAHMEATSEKAALAHHLDGRVAAVVGSHTHVPTADARVLPGGTAFLTDLGMCGPYDSCIGRDKAAVVQQMTSGMYVPFGMGKGDERLCGAVIDIEDATRRARGIIGVSLPADPDAPPFSDVLGDRR